MICSNPSEETVSDIIEKYGVQAVKYLCTRIYRLNNRESDLIYIYNQIPKRYYSEIVLSADLNNSEFIFLKYIGQPIYQDVLMTDLLLQAQEIGKKYPYAITIRGFSLLDTTITTTCDTRLNLIQYLVHTYWYCEGQNIGVLKDLCLQFGTQITLAAAKSLQLITDELDYISVFNHVRAIYSKGELLEDFHII